jgi:hypothetical protein
MFSVVSRGALFGLRRGRALRAGEDEILPFPPSVIHRRGARGETI